MRKELRDKLYKQSAVALVQSKIYQNDISIINELHDLIQDQKQSQTTNEYYQINSINGYRNRMKMLDSVNKIKNTKTKNQISKIPTPFSSNIGDSFNIIQHRSRNKYNFDKHNQLIGQNNKVRTHLRSHFIDLEEKQRRKSFNEHLLFQTKKQENSKFKIKYDYNRSSIMKNKQFIYNNLLQLCQNCNSIKSQVLRNNLICSNKKCQLLNLYQDFQTFPLAAILYELETPSSSCEQLEQFTNKIKQQIKKIENLRNSLMELQFQINSIIQNRKQFARHNKSYLKNFITALSSIKSRKKQGEVDIKECRDKLQCLDLKQIYEQFNKWKKIDTQKYHQNKLISDLINNYKPFCFKTINSDIAEVISDVTDNFRSILTVVDVSEYLSYNFFGDISKMVLQINGSIQLRRQNFLLIENLQELKLIFQSRKTNRQLRQLFNILPNLSSVSLVFDYKLHSHVSSQTFPLIAKTCQLAQNSVEISLINARPEVFQDLLQMSKTVKSKHFFKLSIKMNPFIPQTEWPQHTRSIQWGTKLVKTIFKDLGGKIKKIDLNLPLYINMQQISEFILNTDCFNLIQLKIKSIQTQQQILKQQQQLNKMLQEIVNKKRLLLGNLIKQKRFSSHPLNKSYNLAKSVYQVLF